MKLLIDMNLSGRWIGLLNHAVWEAVHWSTVGSDIAADSEIMAFAAENEWTRASRPGLHHPRSLVAVKSRR